MKFILPTIFLLVTNSVFASDCVIFLHGLARTSSSMNKISEAFKEEGYSVSNVDYPSRKYPIEKLAPMVVRSGVSQCPREAAVHFVTHSLGGILIRYYLEKYEIPRLGRVVMLAPPNQGSEVVDNYRNIPGFEALNGPAGMQLGTDESGVPANLGKVNFELGIIAGTQTINPILSQSLPNPDDGKVSVERTKVEGMSDFVAVPHSHPFIMQVPEVIEYAISFIESGRFGHDAP